MESPAAGYAPETIGSIMSVRVPTCHPTESFHDIVSTLSQSNWDDIDHVYVVDAKRTLLGHIDIASLMQSKSSVQARSLQQPIGVSLRPEADQETAVALSLEHDVDAIAVTDAHGIFVGAVTAKAIIDVMHEEHLEDVLISAGLHGRRAHIVKLATARLGSVLKSRAPWLLMGVVVGLGLGVISSWFEGALKSSIALAYFIPVVTYIADSVGTQSEAITIRALAVIKVRTSVYIIRELAIGILLGLALGVIGGVGAVIISGSVKIGWVVGLSLLSASAVACLIASCIPLYFRRIGKDPALGSGPLATAIQDIVSVVIYFGFALLII